MNRASLLLACVLTLTGCGTESNDMSREEKFAQLMRRPAEEQVVQQYDRMQQEIADELTTAIGLPGWTVNEHTAGEALCGHEFSNLGSDAGTKTLPILGAAAAIPDQQWEQAARIAETITRRNGFGPPQHIVNRPGHHVVEFKDDWGGDLTMGTQVHSSLSVRTGCHLTEEAKQRGTPEH